MVRIDHKDDGHDVADKIFDYSTKTIENLIEQGSNHTLLYMDLQLMKEKLADLEKIYNHYNKKIEDNIIENLEESLYNIQVNIKNQNSYTNIINEVNNFISK